MYRSNVCIVDNPAILKKGNKIQSNPPHPLAGHMPPELHITLDYARYMRYYATGVYSYRFSLTYFQAVTLLQSEELLIGLSLRFIRYMRISQSCLNIVMS